MWKKTLTAQCNCVFVSRFLKSDFIYLWLCSDCFTIVVTGYSLAFALRFNNSSYAWNTHSFFFVSHWFEHLRQFSSSLLSEQSSSSSHLQMVGIHLLLLHWNCPSSHSSVAGKKGGETGSRWISDKRTLWVVSASSSTVICKWMPNWYSAFIQVNWLRRLGASRGCVFSFSYWSHSN